MANQKVNYHFHNPNTEELAAEYILNLFIASNCSRVDRFMSADPLQPPHMEQSPPTVL